MSEYTAVLLERIAKLEKLLKTQYNRTASARARVDRLTRRLEDEKARTEYWRTRAKGKTA